MVPDLFSVINNSWPAPFVATRTVVCNAHPTPQCFLEVITWLLYAKLWCVHHLHKKPENCSHGTESNCTSSPIVAAILTSKLKT